MLLPSESLVDRAPVTTHRDTVRAGDLSAKLSMQQKNIHLRARGGGVWGHGGPVL